MNLRTGRNTPPDEDEWPHLYERLEKVPKMWLVVGPIYAVVSNWKALVAVVMVVAWINSPEIIAAIRAIAGYEQ